MFQSILRASDAKGDKKYCFTPESLWANVICKLKILKHDFSSVFNEFNNEFDKNSPSVNKYIPLFEADLESESLIDRAIFERSAILLGSISTESVEADDINIFPVPRNYMVDGTTDDWNAVITTLNHVIQNAPSILVTEFTKEIFKTIRGLIRFIDKELDLHWWQSIIDRDFLEDPIYFYGWSTLFNVSDAQTEYSEKMDKYLKSHGSLNISHVRTATLTWVHDGNSFQTSMREVDEDDVIRNITNVLRV